MIARHPLRRTPAGVHGHQYDSRAYTAGAFEQVCKRLGATQSMARVGSCPNNTCAEAFNSTIKVEYVYRQHFPDQDRRDREDQQLDQRLL